MDIESERGKFCKSNLFIYSADRYFTVPGGLKSPSLCNSLCVHSLMSCVGEIFRVKVFENVSNVEKCIWLFP